MKRRDITVIIDDIELPKPDDVDFTSSAVPVDTTREWDLSRTYAGGPPTHEIRLTYRSTEAITDTDGEGRPFIRAWVNTQGPEARAAELRGARADGERVGLLAGRAQVLERLGLVLLPDACSDADRAIAHILGIAPGDLLSAPYWSLWVNRKGRMKHKGAQSPEHALVQLEGRHARLGYFWASHRRRGLRIR